MGRRAVQDGLASAIAALFDAVESSADELLIARSAVGSLERFGFTGASIQLLRHRDEGALLETVAASGVRAPFMIGTAQSLTEAAGHAEVMATGTAAYLDDPGECDPSEDGVSRWREGSAARGHGILPLRVAEQRLGVLTIEWPDKPPESRDRAALDVFAGALALTLLASRDGTPASDTPALVHESAPRVLPQPPARVTTLEVTTEGSLFPPSAGAGMGMQPVAHLRMTGTPAVSPHAAFVEANSGPSGSVLLAAGTLHATERADALVGSAAAVARAAAPQSRDVSDALGLLAGWLAGHSGSGLALSAVMAHFIPRKNAFAVSTAGACAMLVLDHDGRFGMLPPECPPFGGAGRPRVENHLRLLLPGDQAAILVGNVSELGHGDRMKTARDLMQAVHDRAPDEVVRELLETVAPGDEPGAVILLDVVNGAG